MGIDYMDATLTFDIDDVEDMQVFRQFAEKVATTYDNVWIRKSSSGNGFHLKIAGQADYDEKTGRMIVADKLFRAEDVIALRDSEEEECRGRLTGDRGRLKVGLQVGRLFGVKSGKSAGEWLPIEAFFKDESILDD
jgi:hypothetical protein|tara:strand:+ start:815 stop:1222 length:408 start_codon:yes stop_codon:yes gene_type:complete